MKPGFILSISVFMAGLFFIDKFLAALERRELISEARSLYGKGAQLLADDQPAAAIATLQRAYTLTRDNRDYELALARALRRAGRLNEAESHLRKLLDRDSNDAATNLTMARLQVQLGNNRQAEAYYHRALYGTWPAGDHAGEVRMELIDFLAEKGEKRQLLSELLLVRDLPKQNAETQKKVGRLFLLAGSPARSEDIYRSLLRQDRDDAGAYVELAEAELAAGDFQDAQASLHSALRRKPDDSGTLERLRLASELSALDPTPRRLTSKDKYERSARVLDLAKASLAECAQREHAEQKVQPLIANAQPRHKTRSPVTNESAESLLASAEELWQARIQVCGAQVSAGDPLPLLMHKVAQ
jgi:tetratricopeptide (TPR) repeat protein